MKGRKALHGDLRAFDRLPMHLPGPNEEGRKALYDDLKPVSRHPMLLGRPNKEERNALEGHLKAVRRLSGPVPLPGHMIHLTASFAQDLQPMFVYPSVNENWRTSIKEPNFGKMSDRMCDFLSEEYQTVECVPLVILFKEWKELFSN